MTAYYYPVDTDPNVNNISRVTNITPERVRQALDAANSDLDEARSVVMNEWERPPFLYPPRNANMLSAFDDMDDRARFQSSILDADISLVATQTHVPPELALRAIVQARGDVVQAIIGMSFHGAVATPTVNTSVESGVVELDQNGLPIQDSGNTD